MNILIYSMIYFGSFLMVFNIIRYAAFVNKIKKIERISKNTALLMIPLILLCFFLAGYLMVGILGSPDIVISGILCGGSVFVFLLLILIFNIVDKVIESDKLLDARYSEMKLELDNITGDSLAVFRVDLTSDVIEDRAGNEMYDEDASVDTYTSLIEKRRKYMILKESAERELFTRNGLLRHYREGHSTASEVILAKRRDGRIGFVKFSATMTEQPSNGNIIAFITERDHNDEVVNDTILKKVLADQYDMIAYIADTKYNVVVRSPEADLRGGIVPKEDSGEYSDFIKNIVLPHAARPDGAEKEFEKTLCLNCIGDRINDDAPYETSFEFVSNGESFYKQFKYFTVNKNAGFYILLVNDMTEARREKEEQNELLRAALEEANRANNAKTVFFSNMSHDIRTPMNAILGFTEIARKNDDMKKVQEYLASIDSSGKHLLSLINDVLELSRIESGKTVVELGRVNLEDIAEDVHDMFTLQMAGKNIEYTVDISGLKNRFVECDKKMIDRVLLNLVSNSYKYTNSGGAVSLTFDETWTDGESSDYTITVADNGIGMSAEFATKIFEAYEMERDPSMEGIQGTGLGMSITKNLVDLMGGTIEVETEKGRGTKFTLKFRFKISSEDVTADKSDAVDYSNIDFSKHRVLIVDDNAINREIAKLMLEEAGFVHDEAENGKIALDKVEEHEEGYYSAILMDVQMPVMDGYTATKAIKAIGGARGAIPVIAISANVFAKDQAEEAQAGMDAHISKPFNSKEMVSTIAGFLK